MLVLSRKVGEKIVLDGNIVVQIIHVQGDKVRIGIEAPQEVSVHREEVFQKLFCEGRAAGTVAATFVAR